MSFVNNLHVGPWTWIQNRTALSAPTHPSHELQQQTPPLISDLLLSMRWPPNFNTWKLWFTKMFCMRLLTLHSDHQQGQCQSRDATVQDDHLCDPAHACKHGSLRSVHMMQTTSEWVHNSHEISTFTFYINKTAQSTPGPLVDFDLRCTWQQFAMLANCTIHSAECLVSSIDSKHQRSTYRGWYNFKFLASNKQLGSAFHSNAIEPSCSCPHSIVCSVRRLHESDKSNDHHRHPSIHWLNPLCAETHLFPCAAGFSDVQWW
jgi:hypothetical protein